MASDGGQSLPSTWQIAWSIGHLIPYVGLVTFSSGVMAPMALYIGLNFFAQSYTDLRPEEIQCEYSTLTPYCREALLDSTQMLMLLSVVCPIVQFVMLPVVGVLSDAVGRWKLVVTSHFVLLLPAFAALSFVLFNTSMHWYYAFVPFTVNPITQVSWASVVFYSMVTDLVVQPEARSAGIGLLDAVGAVATVLGNLLGSCLSIRTALIMSIGIGCFAFVYLLVLMPETWPVEKRTRILTWRSLLPGVELSILFRTKALQLLSCTIMLTGLLDAGFGRISPIYVQWQLNWTARASYINSMAGGIGVIVSLGLLFRPLAMRLGDVGMLAVGRIASTLTVIFFIISWRPWHIITVTCVSSGAIAFALPAVAGLKSSLVGPEDQGGMQGALNTIFSISCSAGVFIFGGLFNLTNRRLLHAAPEQQQGLVNKSAFVIAIVASLPVLWLISKIPAAMRSGSKSGRQGTGVNNEEDYGSLT